MTILNNHALMMPN